MTQPHAIAAVERAMGTESSRANQLIFLTYPEMG